MTKPRSPTVQAITSHSGPLAILVLLSLLFSSQRAALAQYPLPYTSLKAYVVGLEASIRPNAGRGSNAFDAPSADQVEAFRLAMQQLLRDDVSSAISSLDALNYDL